MTADIDNWVEFWDTQEVMDDKSWRKNAELLVDGLRPFLPFQSDDVVLDLGSGPGMMAELVADEVKEIHCVDTSERYVNQAKKSLSSKKNTQCYLLGEEYLDFSFLKDKTYSKIICASVIQYYKSIEEVEELITTMKRLSKPGGKMLIADISVSNSFISDLTGLVTTAWKKKYLVDIMKFMLRSSGGDYSRLRKEKGLLSVKKSDLDSIAAKHHLQVEWRNDILTLNKSRWHFLIHF